jgi:TRAP-type C4-dicarboxylate transport system substrate-binding protein
MKKKFFLITLCMAVCINLALLFPYTTPPAQSADQIKIKIANFFPPPANQSKITDQFGKDLEKRSGGRIKVQYFAGGSLLKAPAIFKGIESGITDIGYAHVYYTPGRFPVSEGLGLPLGTPSAFVGAHVAWDFYQQFKPKEWDKVKLLALHGNAPSMIISKKPVKKLEDLKGLAIRAPGTPGEIIKALGGNPTPTPMMETYDSLAKGVNDGVYAPYETLKVFRFAEVCKYVTAAWQTGNPFAFFLAMNKRKYNSLPPDLKEVVDTLSGEYQERYALMWNGIETAGKAFGLTKGVTYFELSDQEAARWVKAVEPVVANYIKKMTGKGYSESEVKGWVDFQRDRIKYWTAMQMTYKIPSPTGPAGMRPEALVLK